MKSIPLLTFLVISLLMNLTQAADNFYSLTTNTLAGQPAELSQYQGKVALVVNVASHCGYTKQYTGLQKLYTDLKDQGFVLLAFPANDFGAQEPGTPEEIAHFCTSKFAVTFPMFEKVVTKGEKKSPIYAALTAKFPEPSWNFCKYLISKKGEVVAFYPSAVTPDAAELVNAITAELKK